MKLRFKVGTHPAQVLHVCRKRTPPSVGEVVKVVDKSVHGSKPFTVRVTEIKVHTGAGDIYFVEQF